jgi:putative ABC transport system permease protein
VIERRSEIGLRRALGATRGHIGRQFVAESLLLGLLGGVAGCALGTAIAALIADAQGIPLLVPPLSILEAVMAALVIGVGAGILPALRAARVTPTEALRAP